jgi:hypothetical protein
MPNVTSIQLQDRKNVDAEQANVSPMIRIPFEGPYLTPRREQTVEVLVILDNFVLRISNENMLSSLLCH